MSLIGEFAAWPLGGKVFAAVIIGGCLVIAWLARHD